MVSRSGSDRHPPRGPAAARRRQARTDRDGDIGMDTAVKGRGRVGKNSSVPTGPAATRGPNVGRGGKNGILSTGAQRAILRQAASGDVSMKETRVPRATLVDFTVDGWKKSKAASNKDGGASSLIEWLEKKARMRVGRRDVKIKKSRQEGDTMIISVPSVDAKAYERMNGYDWAGAKLAIARIGGAVQEKESSNTADVKAMLRGVLERRWNPTTKILDLAALGQDEELKSQHMFDKRSTSSKFFPAMMVVLDGSFSTPQERDEAIQAVTLASNELEDLKVVSSLSESLPNLKNLDLSNNKFATLGSLGVWRRRFKKLEHLIISNNPIEQNEPNYAAELVTWYPNLRILNNVQVRTEEDIINKNHINNLAFPIRGPRFQDDGNIAETFIRNWFGAFDADRAALAQAFYDEHSDFSITLNTSGQRDPAGSQSYEKQEWDAYIKLSRNFKKVTHLPARKNRLFRGAKSVYDAFSAMPKTKHPDLAESEKWMIESHVQPGIPDITGNSPAGVDGFLISIHGEFDELDTNKKRSMDHLIVIGPGGPTGVRVVSHTITVRTFGGRQAFQPIVNTPPMPATEPSAADGVPQLPPGLAVEVAEQMVTELAKQTGMTVAYAHDCLAQTGWDFNNALSVFQSVKANLPADAFVNGAAAA